MSYVHVHGRAHEAHMGTYMSLSHRHRRVCRSPSVRARAQTLSRRKQKMAAKIMELVGVSLDQTDLDEAMRALDLEIRATNSVPEKSPIAPRSRYIVEQKCAAVMEKLGYRSLVTTVPNELADYGQGYVEGPLRRGPPNSSASPFHPSHASRVLLAHRGFKPGFALCPLRLCASM
jgi:hypothetical protein